MVEMTKESVEDHSEDPGMAATLKRASWWKGDEHLQKEKAHQLQGLQLDLKGEK